MHLSQFDLTVNTCWGCSWDSSVTLQVTHLLFSSRSTTWRECGCESCATSCRCMTKICAARCGPALNTHWQSARTWCVTATWTSCWCAPCTSWPRWRRSHWISRTSWSATATSHRPRAMWVLLPGLSVLILAGFLHVGNSLSVAPPEC